MPRACIVTIRAQGTCGTTFVSKPVITNPSGAEAMPS